MKPIPKRLLPNQVKYKKSLGNIGEGMSYDQPLTLKNVKIEEKKRYYYSTNGKELVGNATMFYDLVNSNGLECDKPTVDSLIEFAEREYKVIDVEVLRGDRETPHHYEVLLK